MSYEDTHIEESEAERINALLVGRTVTKVGDDTLSLDDGTVLKIEANEGCGGCSAGWYELKALNGCENVITRAEVAEEPVDSDDEWDELRRYTLFVFADNQKVNLATVEGDDGNGYYGTGFTIVVTPAETPKET
jgi:hypothetical protein